MEYFLLCEIKRTFIHSASITISTRYTYAKLIVDKKNCDILSQSYNTIKKKTFAIHQHLNIKYNFIHFFFLKEQTIFRKSLLKFEVLH